MEGDTKFSLDSPTQFSKGSNVLDTKLLNLIVLFQGIYVYLTITCTVFLPWNECFCNLETLSLEGIIWKFPYYDCLAHVLSMQPHRHLVLEMNVSPLENHVSNGVLLGQANSFVNGKYSGRFCSFPLSWHLNRAWMCFSLSPVSGFLR